MVDSKSRDSYLNIEGACTSSLIASLSAFIVERWHSFCNKNFGKKVTIVVRGLAFWFTFFTCTKDIIEHVFYLEATCIPGWSFMIVWWRYKAKKSYLLVHIQWRTVDHLSCLAMAKHILHCCLSPIDDRPWMKKI